MSEPFAELARELSRGLNVDEKAIAYWGDKLRQVLAPRLSQAARQIAYRYFGHSPLVAREEAPEIEQLLTSILEPGGKK